MHQIFFSIVGPSFIGIGNPGRGKSTIMNSLAGECLFTAGQHWREGEGLGDRLPEAYEPLKKNKHNRWFYDTPRLTENAAYRTQAGEHISKALNNGGQYQIVFFMEERSGRAIEEDAVTMKLVLRAAPEIGCDFGIIVNKVKQPIMKDISDANISRFRKHLFDHIEGETEPLNIKKHEHSNIVFLDYNEQLFDEDNILLPVSQYSGFPTGLEEFTKKLPVVSLTADHADFLMHLPTYNRVIQEQHAKTIKIEELEKELEEQGLKIQSQIVT